MAYLKDISKVIFLEVNFKTRSIAKAEGQTFEALFQEHRRLNDLGLHRISAESYITNFASHRVLEKAGFTYECRLWSSIFKDGK